jgi:carbonic anhydrase
MIASKIDENKLNIKGWYYMIESGDVVEVN